jgi:hypothetical protein
MEIFFVARRGLTHPVKAIGTALLSIIDSIIDLTPNCSFLGNLFCNLLHWTSSRHFASQIVLQCADLLLQANIVPNFCVGCIYEPIISFAPRIIQGTFAWNGLRTERNTQPF